jgi:ribonuclease-3
VTVYTRLEALLGTGLDHDLLERALTHRSYAYEHGGLPTNERLEFLGDAVLGVVVTDALYTNHPDLAEGSLAKLRASVVSTRALAGVARALGLGEWMRLGKGEDVTGGRNKPSILADTMEAIIGAVYLERGLEGATAMVRRLFDPLMEAAAMDGAALDWKTALQELTAARGLGVPDYAITESGPDHAKSFVATALVAGRPRGEGAGSSKKEAEQQAAEGAWRVLSAETLEALEPLEPIEPGPPAENA